MPAVGTGVNTIMYYAPTMPKAVEMSTNAALFATIANGAISVLMIFAGIWLPGRIGRQLLPGATAFCSLRCIHTVLFGIMRADSHPHTLTKGYLCASFQQRHHAVWQ